MFVVFCVSLLWLSWIIVCVDLELIILIFIRFIVGMIEFLLKKFCVYFMMWLNWVRFVMLVFCLCMYGNF